MASFNELMQKYVNADYDTLVHLAQTALNNLLPACKNIGATHLTGGCYRLHPVEWNVGEASGTLAAYCLENGLKPVEVWENEKHLRTYQQVLEDQGVQLHWNL